MRTGLMIKAALIIFALMLAVVPSLTSCQPIRPDPVEHEANLFHERGQATTQSPVAPFHLSKYDNVSVYTIEESDNEGRSLLHVSYPVTEHGAINARMKEVALEFIDEYRVASEEIEAAYREYRRDTGREEATLVTSYRQHFDVSAADANMIFFVVSSSRYVGGWSDERAYGFFFDRRNGGEMLASDLFVDDLYVQRLSDLTRSALEKRARAAIAEIDFDSDAARSKWLELSEKWIRDATPPAPEAFDNILFGEDGTLRVRLDVYQVVPGLEGVVEVEVAIDEIADLLRADVRQLLAGMSPVDVPFPRPVLKGQGAGTPLAQSLQPPVEEQPSCLEVPCVALTFDDGPSIYTERLLDILKEHDVRATFFVVGQSARIHAATIRRMDEEGHQIGNHTWNHPNLTELSDELIQEQIQRTDSIISQIIGETTPHMRPPYAAYNDHVLAVSGMPFILWSVDPLDWRDRDPEIVAARIIASPAGAIILAHDIHRTTVEAMPSIVASLKGKGIRFVTVTELLGPQTLESGHTYFRQSDRE
ncbi:MAG: polysaccharide deacetylase family protein [Caldilineaceae bacterium]|nr:polysaccharide deacetylase family protein [Caldilineaceae bacterium]